MMTLRHILVADACPTMSENGFAPVKPKDRAPSRKSRACGPPNSMDEAMRFGPMGVITAAST